MRSVNCSEISPSVSEVVFNDFFDEKISPLPPTITHLTLGYNFEQEITILPPSLSV